MRDDLRVGNSKAALARAEEIQAAAPNDPAMLETLGRTQLAASRPEQAVATFEVLQLRPDTPELLRTRAGAARNKKSEWSRAVTRKVLALKPDLLEAQRQLMVLRAPRPRMTQARWLLPPRSRSNVPRLQ